MYHTEGTDTMIDSIIRRNDRRNPYNETQITIIRSAAKLFLKEGYTKTTIKKVEQDSGVKVGNITYYFRSKEDLFLLLVEELMDFHAAMLEKEAEDSGDHLYAYAMEIAAQIALCEGNPKAWDLYHSAYSLPHTYEHIRNWAAEKNSYLLRDRLPSWSEREFREKELVASGIELAALKTFCERGFTLDKKVSLFLDSLMRLYDISERERSETIEKVLQSNYRNVAEEMFERFINRLDREISNQN